MVNGYRVTSLEEALEIRKNYKVIPYGGGTDLMVHPDEKAIYLFLNKIPEMKEIVDGKDFITIGAACTFTEMIDCSFLPPILREAISGIAAPAIRNLGTPGGNIANASPKADSGMVFYVLEAELLLKSHEGERWVPIDGFYLGRQQSILKEDELLVAIRIPKRKGDYYYKKVGGRSALAISRVSFAGVIEWDGDVIKRCITSFGAVKDKIISRKDIDALLVGKTKAEATQIKGEYLKAYDEEIQPIRGRVSAEYRKNVCMNLLKDFLEANGI